MTILTLYGQQTVNMSGFLGGGVVVSFMGSHRLLFFSQLKNQTIFIAIAQLFLKIHIGKFCECIWFYCQSHFHSLI